GFDDGSPASRGNSEGLLPTVEEYDPATNKWTKRSEMPTPRGFLGAAVVKGKVLTIGGLYAARCIEVYDPATATWKRLQEAPLNLYRFGMVLLGDTIYTLGGEETPQT